MTALNLVDLKREVPPTRPMVANFEGLAAECHRNYFLGMGNAVRQHRITIMPRDAVYLIAG